eukprot:jgi/Mesvir1/26323/Mv22503-RA.1
METLLRRPPSVTSIDNLFDPLGSGELPQMGSFSNLSWLESPRPLSDLRVPSLPSVPSLARISSLARVLMGEGFEEASASANPLSPKKFAPTIPTAPLGLDLGQEANCGNIAVKADIEDTEACAPSRDGDAGPQEWQGIPGDAVGQQHMEPITADANQSRLERNTTSEDEKLNSGGEGPVDERRARRMLSNRESARRSRQRKQAHLDELRNQASQLRQENANILSKLHFATQHYGTVTEENRLLRSHVLELTQSLARLRELAAFQGASMQRVEAC